MKKKSLENCKITHFFKATQSSYSDSNEPKTWPFAQKQTDDIGNTIKNESQPSSFERFLGSKRGQDQINKEESPVPKRLKVIPTHWDPEVFESLPNIMKEELLKSEQISSQGNTNDMETKTIVKDESVSRDHHNAETSAALPKKTENIPGNWDAQVFADLPKDIQKELLMQNQKKDIPAKKKSTSSILNYFTKK